MEFVGKPEEDVINELKAKGFKCRLDSRDGKKFMQTMDAVPTRYNLTVVKGIVTSIRQG